MIPSYPTGSRPRILVTGLSNGLGGTEAVVGRYVEALRGRISFDFLSVSPLDALAFVGYGDAHSFVAPSARTPLQRRRWLHRFFLDYGKEFQGIWANFNHLLYADVLREAKRVGIPVRIAHAHNTRFLGGFTTQMESRMRRRGAVRSATVLAACSREAGLFFWGEGNQKCTVVPNAFDFSKFAFNADARMNIRQELGIPSTAHVVGTVGRLAEQKNQGFLIDVLHEMRLMNPDVMLVIVGEGPLKSSLLQHAIDKGVSDALVMAGARSDIPSILSSFDAFAFPSKFEGLPVSFLEAQANGLPCVCSNVVPTAAVISNGVQMLPVGDARAWAERLMLAERPCVLGGGVIAV